MAIGPYTQKFQEQSHQYLCMVAQERAEVGCLKERLTQNPADFKALMDSIISVERIGGSNGVVRAQLEESCGFLAQNAMAYEGMSSELLVAAMVGVFSRELSLCEQLSVYSSITGYTTARAKAFVEEYMTIIEGIKANTVNPAVGLNQIRVYQRLLVELAPYFPKEERTQKYVEETQEYLSSGRRESLSSTREAIQIGDLTERLEEYQRQIERKGEAALQVINLAEKIIAMQTALSTLPAEERMAKEEELSSTKDRWEQANANQIYLLQMAPLDQVLESVKEYLANYEEGDLADVSRLFGLARFLMTLQSTKILSAKIQLTMHVAKRESLVKMVTEYFPKLLGRPPSAESKQRLLELLRNTRADVQQATELLGLGKSSEEEDVAEAAEAAQMINQQIKGYTQYLKELAGAKVEFILASLPQIARDLNQIVIGIEENIVGFEKEDPVFQQATSVIAYLKWIVNEMIQKGQNISPQLLMHHLGTVQALAEHIKEVQVPAASANGLDELMLKIDGLAQMLREA